MNFKNVNWIAIVLAVVAAMVVGFLWYGFLFVNQWMVGNGITYDEATKVMAKNGVAQPTSAMPMIMNTIAMVVYALFMHWLLNKTGDRNLKGGLTVGLVLGLVQLIGVYIGNSFAFNSHTLTLVDGSYTVVLFAIMGAIIGAMPKKVNE